ncbi:hypothetical protein K474DRAFT_231833 [Panus rudis PR-1116 ss-1]|nr:hypothetical protein K474DRAFT_231833 [Panus rudis PR-1116 ss-1]
MSQCGIKGARLAEERQRRIMLRLTSRELYGIEVDFDSLDEEEREADANEKLAEFDESIAKLNGYIERMAPNMKAMDRLDDVEAKLVETEKARKESKTAREQFNDVKKRRCNLFMKAYDHISGRIDGVYKSSQ